MAEQKTTTMAAKEVHDVDEEGSPITDAESESEKKLDDYVDEESPPNVSAADCDDNVPPRAKRKREPKKSDDYEQSRVNDSPVTCVCEESRDHEISLDELLDTLHTPLTPQVCSALIEPQPTVSHWSLPYNNKCIRKYFKMRRCVVSADEFIVRYLFCGNKNLREIEKRRFATELYTIQDWFEKTTSCIDTTETELFLPSRCDPDEADGHRQLFFDEVMEHRDKLMDSSGLPGLDGENFAKKYSKFRKAYILRTLSIWMQKVANAAMLSPSAVHESTYEDVFQHYLEMFPLSIIGKSATLGIPYRNGEVSSVPDLIFRRDRAMARFFGVVEVKKMTLDPTLKHAYEEPPKHGILNDSDDGLKPPKMRCVNFCVGASAATTNEGSEGDDERQDALHMGGSPLTDSQRHFIKPFFGELFGHALALDCCPPTWCYPHGASAFPQRLGIGVVGFREVPCVGSHRMDVFMTPVLSLLNASDRKEITKILLALSTNEPKLLSSQKRTNTIQ